MQFEQFASSVAKVAEKTRQDGSVIGNAYKTILARTSRSQSADLDVSDEDRSKASKALSAIGISVYDQNGEYQDFSKTLDQLSEKWDQLSKSQQAYIAEQMAGVRNLNTMSAIIETWQDAKSLASDALTDTDFINETQEKYENSIEGHLEKLKASGQDFWNTLLDSGAINTGINLLSGVVDVAQKAVDVFGALGDALPVVNSGFTTLTGTLATAYAAYKVFANVKSTESIVEGFKLTGTQLKDAVSNILEVTQKLKTSFGEAFKEAGGGISGLISGVTEAAGAMGVLGKAVLGVSAAIAAIGAVVWAIDQVTTSSKEAEEAAQKAADSYQKGQDKISNAKTLVDTNGSELVNLSRGIDEYGNNISLTSNEFERYHEICNQVAKMFPTLVSGYDEQGNAIIKLKDGVKSLNDEYDRLRLTEANENIANEDVYQEDFGNKNGKRSFGTKFFDTLTNLVGSADRGGRTDDKEALNALEEISNLKSVKEYNDWMYDNRTTSVLSNIKKEANISTNITTDKQLKQQQKKIKEYTTTITKDLDESGDKIKTAMQSWLTKMTLDSNEYPQYQDIDDAMVSRVSTLINSIDSKKLQELDDKGISNEQYVQSLLDGLTGNEKAQIALDDILKLDDSSSIEDMKKAIDKDLQVLDKALENDSAAELKVRLKLDEKQDIIDQAEKVVEDAGKQLTTQREKQADAIAENIDKAFEGNKDKEVDFDTSKIEDALTGLKEYKRELEDEWNTINENGNVDYSKRKIKTAEEMWSKGWDQPHSELHDDDTITTFTNGYWGDSFDNSLIKNKNLYVEVTPILDNGEVLTPEELDKYMENLFQQEDMLFADKVENGGKGILVNLFDNPSEKSLDDYFEKLDKVKQEHAELADVIEQVQGYVDKGDTDGLAKYFNDIYDSVGDDKLLKDILKSSKQAAKQSKELEKNTSKTTKNNKNLEASEKRVRQFIKDNNLNTKEQLDLLDECINSTDTWADAIEKFNIKNINSDFDEVIKNLEQNLKTVENDITNINEAIQASHTSIGLTKDEIDNVVKAFSGLDGYNYDQLFESTAEGVHLNVQELDRLNGEYRKMQQDKYDDQISRASEEYEKLCLKINNTTDATERKNAIDAKNRLGDQIKELRELQSRYEGLTNAVTRYQQAKENGEEGQTYDNITADKDDIKELYDHGLVGTNQFKAAVQMMTSEDLSGQGTGKYLEVYKKKAEEFFSYFTENGEGVEKFLKKLQTGGFASQNKDGSWNIQADIEEISKKFDMDQSVINEMFNKLKDYGFDVDFKEESDNLKKVREEAEKARDALDEKYKLNLDVDDPNKITDITKGAENLRSELVATFGEGSDQVKNFDKQLEYLKKKQGDLATADWSIDIHSSKGLEDLQKQMETLNKMDKDIELNIDFTSESPEYIKTQLSNIKTDVEELKLVGKDGKIDVSVEGGSEAISLIQGLITRKKELDQPSFLKVDTSQLEGETQKAIQDLQSIYNQKKDLDALLTAKEMHLDVDDNAIKEAQKNLKSMTEEFNNSHPEVAAKVKLDQVDFSEEKVDKVASDITNRLNSITPTMTVEAGVDSSLVDGYNPDSKTMDVDADTSKAKKKVDDLTSNVENANPTLHFKQKGLGTIQEKVDALVQDKTATITITKNIVEKKTKQNDHNGNAHAQGNSRPSLLSRGKAFARGTWGAVKSGMSLVGELGREIIVRGNQWFTVGDNGAEMFDVKKNDIIFNHLQSEQILQNGYVTADGGRAKMANSSGNAHKSGSAYVSGTYTTAGSLPGTNKFYNNYKWKSKKKDKSSSDDKDDFSNDFDWIEVWLNRIERDIKNLDTVASSVYKNFTKRNNTLVQEFSKVSEEINRQQSAYDAYMQAANSLGISSTYMDKIANGTLELETITDEDLSDKLSKAQDWYDKALDARDAIYDLKETLGDLAKQKFDNVAEEYDNQLQLIEHRITSVENGLDIVEAKGNFASQSYFDMLEKAETENINKILQEYNSLKSAFDEAMNTGAIEKGSSAWYEMQQQINEVSEAWQEATKSLIEYKNQAREMDWSIFDYKQDLISQITEESDFIQNLLSLNEADMYSKKSGKLTNVGQSVGGLHALNYNVYMAQADEYRKKVEEINKELASDPYNTKLLDQRNEYLKSQREAIENANDEKTAIHDLIEESYNRMLNILQKLIDKRKEYLQAQKDIYDYEKNIREQTKNITDLQKQLTALQGDDSEEAQSKRQQIISDLESAKSDLQDSEYDKWLDDQEQLLDKLYDQYEEVLNERLDNLDGLVMDMIDATNNNSATINQTIQDYTTGQNGVGYQISNGMKDIWNTTGSGIGKVVSDYSTNFVNTLTTTNNYIKSINDYMYKLVQKAEREAQQNTVAAGAGTPGSSSSGNSSMPASSSSSNSGSSNNGGGNSGNFFVYKYDSYPKGKLSINTSIVDRLKYHNYDSSFGRRRSYYAAMGFGGNYTGSASQNVSMIQWMRLLSI